MFQDGLNKARARTDPSLAWGKRSSLQCMSDLEGDPLKDTTSHIPAASLHSKNGEASRYYDNSVI
jgi:hypothetical protein